LGGDSALQKKGLGRKKGLENYSLVTNKKNVFKWKTEQFGRILSIEAGIHQL